MKILLSNYSFAIKRLKSTKILLTNLGGSALFCAIAVLIAANNAYADDLKKTVEIAAGGSKFQAERIKIAAENMANEYSTASSSTQDPYRRKIVFAENRYDKKVGTHLLKTKKIDHDKSEFILKYDPHHPAANEEGYVKYPNVNREIERADASEAQRGYEANLNVIEMTNGLVQKTIEAIR